jgi:mannose/fructose-specific phosphotransferase system component IIA
MSYPGIIITHGNMGQCLIGTLARITGENQDLLFLSNEGRDADDLVETLGDMSQPFAGQPLFIFTEIRGGSTWFAARKVARQRGLCAILTGVNLPMLVSFVSKRMVLAPTELQEKMIDDAQRGIALEVFGDIP